MGDAWADPASGVEVQTFSGQRFREREPEGDVYEMDLLAPAGEDPRSQKDQRA